MKNLKLSPNLHIGPAAQGRAGKRNNLQQFLKAGEIEASYASD